MNTHADKIDANKSQSVSNGESQLKRGGESTFQFLDNRPEAIAQMKLQEMGNNSPQVSKLRALQEMANNSPQTKKMLNFSQWLTTIQCNSIRPFRRKKITLVYLII